MKVYIHTDLEGVTGIDDEAQVDFENSEVYRQSCEKLMLDVNAAVAGAFEGGADHVTVVDCHGGQERQNFILDMLDERAEHDVRPAGNWWGILDGSYDATYFLGAHAMAGTINGFLDHTQSFYVFNYTVNGRRMGEVEQWAIVAGGFGVPLLMVSGDEAGCAEARAFLSPIETAAVKQGLGRNRAAAYPADEARERIRQSARRAVDLVGEARPFKPLLPMEIRVEYTRTDRCDRDARREGVERLDARTVRMVTSDPLDILPWRRPFREA